MREADWTSKDGTVQLYCGDCREILPELGKVDAVVTDPPYGVVNRESSGLRSLDKDDADIVTVPTDILMRLIVGAPSVYVWCGTEQISDIRKSLVLAGYSTRLCIWEKSNPSPMNGQFLWLSGIEACVFGKLPKAFFSQFCKNPVFRGPSSENNGHPTPKPVWLMQIQVDASCPKGGTVLDPFLGSGTTGVACVNLKRRFIGIEIDRGYFDIAVKRIEQAFEARKQQTVFDMIEETSPVQQDFFSETEE